jgi:hypothetical protein
MNDLEKYFRQNNNRLIDKWVHYFDIYDRHFKRYRNQEVVILEIGVSQGGSLQMWKNYFGNKAKIFGIDIDPRCKSLEEENITIFVGSQSDKKFLGEVKKQIPPIDILIDDGGHTMKQQIISYKELFGVIKANGVYLCEDLHSSYSSRYGGGYKRRGTFIEYSKNFIDYLNAYHSRQKWVLPINSFTQSVDSIHYYDSVIVIEKKKREKPPHAEQTGKVSFSTPSLSPFKQKLQNVKDFSNLSINYVLRFFRIPDFHI